jgi:hypothetical protein
VLSRKNAAEDSTGETEMAEGYMAASFRDYGGEPSTFRIRTAEVTAANFDAQATLVSNFMTAVEGLQEADVPVGRLQHGNETLDAQSESSTAKAQRETKALVRYEDDTTKKVYRIEIPCVDLAHLDADNRGFFELDDGGDVAAFVTAFEAIALAPQTGNTVTVLSIEHVARDL